MSMNSCMHGNSLRKTCFWCFLFSFFPPLLVQESVFSFLSAPFGLRKVFSLFCFFPSKGKTRKQKEKKKRKQQKHSLIYSKSQTLAHGVGFGDHYVSKGSGVSSHRRMARTGRVTGTCHLSCDWRLQPFRFLLLSMSAMIFTSIPWYLQTLKMCICPGVTFLDKTKSYLSNSNIQ